MLLLHDSVKLLTTVNTPFNKSFESVATRIKFKGKEIFISKFYQPPNSNDVNFMNSLKMLVSQSNKSKCKLGFLCCDQNYDLLKLHLHVPTRNFQSFVIDEGFVPLIGKPTRVTHSTATMIDNVYVMVKEKLKNIIAL